MLCFFYLNNKRKAREVFNALDMADIDGDLSMNSLPCGIYQVVFDARTQIDADEAQRTAKEVAK